MSFGKTILKPEEILVSVLFPFSRKVQMWCLRCLSSVACI